MDSNTVQEDEAKSILGYWFQGKEDKDIFRVLRVDAFCGSFPVTKDDICKAFLRFGELTRIALCKNKDKMKGWVEFRFARDAKVAMATLNDCYLYDSDVCLIEIKPTTPFDLVTLDFTTENVDNSKVTVENGPKPRVSKRTSCKPIVQYPTKRAVGLTNGRQTGKVHKTRAKQTSGQLEYCCNDRRYCNKHSNQLKRVHCGNSNALAEGPKGQTDMNCTGNKQEG